MHNKHAGGIVSVGGDHATAVRMLVASRAAGQRAALFREAGPWRKTSAFAVTLAMSALASCASDPAPAPDSAPAHASAPRAAAAGAQAQSHTAQLFPANSGAEAGGVRSGRVTDEGAGRGTLEFTMPYGEKVRGECAPVTGSATGFGALYNALFGPNAAASAAKTGTPGRVSGYGADGTQIECEYYRNGSSGQVSGACRTSTGFLYRLQY